MKSFSILLALPLLVAACGERNVPGNSPSDSVRMSESSGSESASSAAASASPVAGDPAPSAGDAEHRRFDVKSGVIELKNSVANGTQTIYFDDYGRKEAIYLDMEMMGRTMRTVQIIDGEWLYSYSPEAKMGQKSRAPEGGVNPIPDPARMSQEKRTEFNYRALEPTDILGKSAEGYSMEMAASPGTPATSVKAWLWKRVPLRMEFQTAGIPAIVTEATKAEFDIDIPAERFRVPKGVTIAESEAQSGMPQGSVQPQASPAAPVPGGN